MYIKSIKMQGFKSFADKTELDFDKNICAIVGPNGSGKSNVVDAVRWVLGESSLKEIRGGEKLTDCIFNGSTSRSASTRAWVSLTFDNSDHYLASDYNEIEIKREVYKTGENEYYINNTKVRKKDITDLFLDSGTNANSFSIISQGKISEILKGKPSDRRVIIEEAASVLKYKKRKEETTRKMDATNDNLEKVNLVINELEVNVEPLRKQADDAKKYLSLKNELEGIEISLIASDIKNINTIYKSDKERLKSLNEEILSMDNTSSVDNSKLESMKLKSLKLDEEISSLSDELIKINDLLANLETKKQVMSERRKYEVEDQKLESNILILKEREIELKKDISVLENKIESSKKKSEEDDKKLKSLIEEEKNEQTKKSTLISELDKKSRELVNVRSKIEVLNDQIENDASLPFAVKSVINNPRLEGIHDVLAKLIDTNEEYIKAIETALGANQNVIVVDRDVDAKNAINYLKDNKLGRATFFPISVIKPRGVDLDTLNVVRNMQGFISVLMDVVKYDSKYYNVVSNQVGNVLLVDNIDNANKISKAISQRYKIVTLDGDIVHIGGTMTGGSLNTSKSIFEEKHELETLRVKRREIAEVIATLEENIKRSTSKLEDNSEKIRQKEIVLIQTQEKYNTKKSSLDITNEEYNNIINELRSLENLVASSLSKEEDRIMKLYYETSREKEEVVREIARSTKEKDKISSTIDNIEATNKLNNTSLYTKEKELKTLEINISKMDVLLDNYLRILSEDYEMTYEKARSNYILEMDTKEARSLVNSYKNRIKQIGMVNVQAIEDYKRVSERYNFLNSQKDDLLNAKDTLLEIINEMDTVMKEEFLTTFNKIDKEFQEVFKQLFKGGSASLKLTNPDDLLETGVDIIASPPGKKLTSINLLSGGEKTLTAICLIFAILNVKPIPFCLFDEVEAALDEANVDNFGKYLNNYKDKTQFLIITHKKRTMEYANTLYGITMQESGVSKLVSVKLDNI